MTMALCFHCGDVKFGALCPCLTCQGLPVSNVDLNIVFSDHQYSEQTLHEFGAVLRAIRAITSKPDEGFWSFIRYISLEHPTILRVDFAQHAVQRLDEILGATHLPPVTVRKSWRGAMLEKAENQKLDLETSPEVD